MRATAFLILSLCVVACGGGSDSREGSFRLLSVHAPSGEPLALDGLLEFRFSEPVDEESLTASALVIETADGRRARGTFVRGRPFVDPGTGSVVVFDPDLIGEQQIGEAERRGDLDLIPWEIRYDLGATSLHSGNRRVLIDRRDRRVVTFLPDIPVQTDLSDTGFAPATEYRVRALTGSAPGALRSVFGGSLQRGSRREPALTIVTKDLGDPGCFVSDGTFGRPVIVNTWPPNCTSSCDDFEKMFLSFSRPLDPSTVSANSFTMEIASVPGRPAVPIAVQLHQARGTSVEVIVSPIHDLPYHEWFTLSVGSEVRDLAGRAVQPGLRFSFGTACVNPVPSMVESFDHLSYLEEDLTTAAWNTTVPGALAGLPGDAVESVAQSRWFDVYCPTPRYGTPEIDADPAGGTIEVFFQSVRRDVEQPGNVPFDPDSDPDRIHTTDWVRLDEFAQLEHYRFLRFRIVLTTAPDGGTTGWVPVVRELRVPVNGR